MPPVHQVPPVQVELVVHPVQVVQQVQVELVVQVVQVVHPVQQVLLPRSQWEQWWEQLQVERRPSLIPVPLLLQSLPLLFLKD